MVIQLVVLRLLEVETVVALVAVLEVVLAVVSLV